jgi:hypothetical protein
MSLTPREILLDRHREAESKLDAIRFDVVSTIARADGEAIDRESEESRDCSGISCSGPVVRFGAGWPAAGWRFSF